MARHPRLSRFRTDGTPVNRDESLLSRQVSARIPASLLGRVEASRERLGLDFRSDWLRQAIEEKLAAEDHELALASAFPFPAKIGFFRAECPRCHKKIWNGLFSTDLGYLNHWREQHVVEDLEGRPEWRD